MFVIISPKDRTIDLKLARVILRARRRKLKNNKMWILSRVIEIKFIIYSTLTLKYCVHVHNTFSFKLQLISLLMISSKNQNSSRHLNKLNDYLYLNDHCVWMIIVAKCILCHDRTNFSKSLWSNSNITGWLESHFDFLSKRGVQPIIHIQGSHMQSSTAYFFL